MKHKILTALLAAAVSSTAGATSTVAFAIGDLRDAAGTPLADGSSTWAIIVSNATNLPGGVTSGANTMTSSAVASDFTDVELTIGDKGSYTITHVGTISSGDLLGAPGVAMDTATFTLSGVVTAGKLWGLYWFPGQSLGATLTGSYEVGGFAQSSSNAASGGSFGTTVPTDGSNETGGNFLETDFNQNIMAGSDTGLDASRFTAVAAVPEPASMTLSALGLAALLRRRRK